MKQIVLILIIIASFSSCKSSKRAKSRKTSSSRVITKKIDVVNTKDEIITDTKNNHVRSRTNAYTTSENIINYAKQFEGVRYKWGGTTKSGMDCSGLIFESFKAYDILLPRISRDMAKRGKKVSLKNVIKGDLLFFKTGNKRNTINHVGLIVAIKNNNIQFIHATSSKGVITSWLNETYWHKAFFEARKIL
ncbi:C40 family peptidase [Thalassobellus sediminis]|uniref:C40 family peptidase n=1 Tax=Thalassobellus sediminis TaxID=3367753 RepID=UPI00379251AC